MDSKKFGEIANDRRWLMIRQWALCSGMTDACTAKILVEHAINNHLVKKRSLTGAYLKKWRDQQRAPLWACLSAFELSLTKGWTPENEEEWIVFSYLFVQLNLSSNFPMLIAALPRHIAKEIAIPWLKIALKNQTEHELIKKSDKNSI